MRVPIDLGMDSLIFDYHQAIYNPNRQEARRSLGSDEDEVRRYLGTYFPRSFAEQQVLWEKLLTSSSLVNTWSNLSKINILDIGSGTGGNVQGILDVLKLSPLSDIPFNVCVNDGNLLALKIQEAIVKSLTYNRVSWNFLPRTFSLRASQFGNELELLKKDTCIDKFDIIVTSKFLSEIAGYAIDNGLSSSGFFEKFLLWAAKSLNSSGILVIVDVPIKPGQVHQAPKYIPTMIREEVKSAREKGFNMRCILPRTCGYYEKICTKNSRECFHSFPLTVSHSRKDADATNILFRVYAHKELASKILCDWGTAPIVTEMSEIHRSFCIRGNVSNNYKTCDEKITTLD